ncbi:pantoate--beta-alanine ligase [Sulfuriferula sp. AH1]|uniref:pantoate--beta-alanine ligase n=1 Tax=Sulfuriferula sp. AH1 TaxID=1985873 RepID=UPI000B3B1767|nr:pantoate--beta-alanine ligase [Sulfuriferula sp. AH1]ARU31712.1 pantoate--beta-alanine ligase [Sulfuriferula sp. AH1]
MQIIHSIEALRAWRAHHNDVAFVPTMGNLHAGHLALVAQARHCAKQVVVSIFVNPLQFGAHEDYSRYPRTLPQDAELLHSAGADIVFAPTVDELFPVPQSFHIEPPPFANELCGAFRPGHFRGVATIVMKLFNIAQPKTAVFGKKDYQQLAIIRGMVADFAMPIEIVAGDTMRAGDGLALSSRNGFLNESERRAAPQLYQVLTDLKAQILNGAKDFSRLERSAQDHLTAQGWRVDYVAIRTPELTLPGIGSRQLVILAAAHLGQTRLIDNIEIER